MNQYTLRVSGPVATTEMLSTREAAKAAGHTFFYTGKPCKRGHVAPRYTSSPLCANCVKENYEKRKPKTLAELKARYQANPEVFKAKERERAYRNPKRYWVKHVVKNARLRASKIGVPFDLTPEYVMSIIPDECPVFGTPFVFVGNGSPCAESASLDRLVPAKGYVVGNVVVISHSANTIKNNATAKEVAKVAQWMYEQGL